MTWIRILAATLLLTSPSDAGVIVVGNFTLSDVTLAVTDADKQTHPFVLAPYQVSPLTVSGPIDVLMPTRAGTAKLRLEPANAYVIVVDPKTDRRIAGIQLPGEPLAEDGNPTDTVKGEPYKIPVTLLVDDADPRADKLWQTTLKQRFEEAAEVVERHSGLRFTFAGFDTWHSDPAAFEPTGLLDDFQRKVSVKPGQLAIGYTSRKIEDKEEFPFGACRGVLSSHLLMREWRPKKEPERVEALIHYLGQIAGAVTSPDVESVMRPKIANGLALATRYKVRFDPLNTLAMSLWAEELRKGPRFTINDVSPANKARLGRVYKALAAAMPDDRLAVNYVNDLDNAQAQARPRPPGPVGPKDPVAVKPMDVAKPPEPDPSLPPLSTRTPQQEAVHQVLRAIVTKARSNNDLSADAGDRSRLRGDDLTAAYVQTAAEAAGAAEEQFRPTAFLVGLGIALDDSGALREDSQTSAFVKAVETDSERQERLAVMGLPTIHSRRDLCQRFAVACAMGDQVGPSTAEEAGLGRSLAAMNKPAGFSFAAVAADLAGIELSQQVKGSPELIAKWRVRFPLANYIPPVEGLREGLSGERFGQDFGGQTDSRLKKAVEDIRDRVARLPGYRN